MNNNIYDSIIQDIDKKIKDQKMKINLYYGCTYSIEFSNDLYKTLTDLQNIKTFINYVHRNLFDKRFYEFMFGNDLSPYVDMRKLSHEIVELIVNAKKLFPKKR